MRQRELHSVRNELAVTNSNLDMMMAQLESRNVALDKLFEDRKNFDCQRDALSDSSFEQQAKQLHEHTERLNLLEYSVTHHSFSLLLFTVVCPCLFLRLFPVYIPDISLSRAPQFFVS